LWEGSAGRNGEERETDFGSTISRISEVRKSPILSCNPETGTVISGENSKKLLEEIKAKKTKLLAFATKFCDEDTVSTILFKTLMNRSCALPINRP
jgi:hypothetical protein